MNIIINIFENPYIDEQSSKVFRKIYPRTIHESEIVAMI
jgi:trehalose utilization protein